MNLKISTKLLKRVKESNVFSKRNQTLRKRDCESTLWVQSYVTLLGADDGACVCEKETYCSFLHKPRITILANLVKEVFLMKFWKHAGDHKIGDSRKGHVGNLEIPHRMGRKETSEGENGRDICASNLWEPELERNSSQEERRPFSWQEEGRNKR